MAGGRCVYNPPVSGPQPLSWRVRCMKTIAQFIVAVAPVALPAIVPFVRIMRGGSAWRAFFLCWVLFVLVIAFFSLGLPIICAGFSRNLAHEVSGWVPEGPAVIAALFSGWFYAGVIVVLAQLTCCFLHKQYPNNDT
jgi:hypothetical protein